MKGRVVASAPGKLILMGEHAAVYRRPAVVAALGLRSRVEVESADRGVQIDLPDLGYCETLGWSAILAYVREARQAWRRYAVEPSRESFERVRGEDPAHLVKVALGEVAEELDKETLPPLALRVSSSLPIGSGFGSSAATAVAVVAALLRFLGQNGAPERVDRLAMEVERRQHGMPSGVDHRTVLMGGLLWACRRPDGSLSVEALRPRSSLLSGLEVFHTGVPKETTGTVVAAVRRQKERRPERFKELLDRMEQDVRQFRAVLTSREERAGQATALVRDYEACLEEMGVVPESVRRSIRRVEALGGAAKISGAGSLSGPGAGCLLVYPAAGSTEAVVEELRAYPRQPCDLGVDGLRVEVET